jgi:hypothetical protein
MPKAPLGDAQSEVERGSAEAADQTFGGELSGTTRENIQTFYNLEFPNMNLDIDSDDDGPPELVRGAVNAVNASAIPEAEAPARKVPITIVTGASAQRPLAASTARNYTVQTTDLFVCSQATWALERPLYSTTSSPLSTARK